MVFSTDDPLPEEEKKEQPPARTMITTNTFKQQQQHTSKIVGANNSAISSLLKGEEKHLAIAKKMQNQFAEKIRTTEVNPGTDSTKPGRGALFGQSGAAKYNLAAEKKHKYFN